MEYETPFQLVVAVLLSAQCTDERVNKTTKEVFRKYPTVYDFNKLSEEELMELFKNINFYKNKSKNIKQLSEEIIKKYKGTVPNDMNELTTLSGIGRKSANVILNDAFKNPCGIAVDTHVKRIAGRLGISEERDPLKIEQDLIKAIPQKYWFKTNHLLVYYGRHICKAKKPECEKCIIRESCPSKK